MKRIRALISAITSSIKSDKQQNKSENQFITDVNIEIYLNKIRLLKPDYIDECAGVYWDMRFWECSCNQNNIKDKLTKPECKICGCHHEDLPDARVVDLFDIYQTEEAINKAAGNYWDKYKDKTND